MLIIGERIKMLRESHNLSQAALAKRLGITRSSVNAWELGLNVPSTQYIIELSDPMLLRSLHRKPSLSVPP